MIKPLLTNHSKNDIKDFAEGSEILEEILLYCFENKIPTHACCAGHITNEKNKRPYLSFLITPQTKNFLSYLLESACLNSEIIETTLMYVDYPDLKKSSCSFALAKNLPGEFNVNTQAFFESLKMSMQGYNNKIFKSPKLDFFENLKKKFCRFELNFKQNNLEDMYVQNSKIIKLSGYTSEQKGILVYYKKTLNTNLQTIEKEILKQPDFEKI